MAVQTKEKVVQTEPLTSLKNFKVGKLHIKVSSDIYVGKIDPDFTKFDKKSLVIRLAPMIKVHKNESGDWHGENTPFKHYDFVFSECKVTKDDPNEKREIFVSSLGDEIELSSNEIDCKKVDDLLGK